MTDWPIERWGHQFFPFPAEWIDTPLADHAVGPGTIIYAVSYSVDAGDLLVRYKHPKRPRIRAESVPGKRIAGEMQPAVLFDGAGWPASITPAGLVQDVPRGDESVHFRDLWGDRLGLEAFDPTPAHRWHADYLGTEPAGGVAD